MAGRKIRNEDEARHCLTAAAESGLSRAEWARERGIDARSLNAWRLNLERPGRARGFGSLRLVELVAAQATTPPARYRVECGPFCVEVDDAFDDAVLGRLLAVMARC